MKSRRGFHGALLASRVAVLFLFVTPALAQEGSCPGDCDGDGRVALGELVRVVNVALGRRALATCALLDADRSGVASIDEMVFAVERSLNGCPRMLQGPEAVRGTSQVALSTMDSLRVLSFGLIAAGGGGGGAGNDETILCDQGSKLVSRRSEGASCTITTTHADCAESNGGLGGAVTRDGTVIQTVADAGACTPPGAIPPDVNVSVTLRDFTETFSEPDGTGVELFAGNLILAREPLEMGASRTKLDGSLRVRRTTGERFTQLFRNFVITEAPDGNGSVAVTQNGRVSIDCIGDLEIRTTLPLLLTSPDAACPVGGELEVEEAPPGEGASPSLVAERTSAAPVATGQQTAVDLGLGANLFRAANGPVYQVLQNAGADADEGAESVRITTLVGSTGAASACESSAGGGLDATAIAAAAVAPFELGAVRKSALIHDATLPCFNGNAEDGAGSVCIGPDCGSDCACDAGDRCVAFTLGAGTTIAQATEDVPAAELADLRDPGAGPCGGFAYAFGTAEPTTRAPECAAEQAAEGFALPVVASQFAGGTDGSTIVFAYDAPLLSDFRASHAGFSIDLDGKNRVGCTGSNKLLGLGIADTDRTPPPRIGFTSDGGVTFDFDGRDDLLNGLVETCRFPALAACIGPTDVTPTPVPSGCPEIELASASSIFVSETTAGRENSAGGASCGDGGNQAPDVTFSYTPPASAFYQIETTGSSFDTILYVRRATCSGLELACNDDDGTSSQSKLVTFLAADEPVVIAVDGFGGASGSVRLQVNAVGVPPTATPTRTPASPAVQPDLVVAAVDGRSAATAGTQIDVTATVQNGGPREASAFDVAFVLSANEAITEDDALLGLCSFSQLDAGASVSCSRAVILPAGASPGTQFLGALADYSRRVPESNEGNNVSDARSIQIIAAGPTPTPAPVCPEMNLPSAANVSDQGSTAALTGDLGGSTCGDGGDFAPDVAYGYTAASSGVYTIDTLGSGFDTLLHVRSETCDGAELACSDDDAQSGTLQSRLTLFLLEGQRIVIVVDGFGSAAGPFTLNVRQESAKVPTSTPVDRVATPTPSGPAIQIGAAAGDPGSVVSFDVSLTTGGEQIAGVQNDITFPADVPVVADGQNRPDCQVNPVIDKDLTDFTFQPFGCVPGVSCTAVRALVIGLNALPIPNRTLLYTCNARIDAGASGGTRPLGCQNPGAARPDASAIEPSCLDGQVEVVGAPAPTPTPTDIPTGPVIRIDGASGNRGQQVTFGVRLETAGRAIVGVQNDVSFDSAIPIPARTDGRPDCVANPAILKEATSLIFQPPGCTPGVSCTGIRAIVLSLDSDRFDDPIPDGALLYSCNVDISATAAAGPHPLTCSRPGGSDALGNTIATGCSGASIDVAGSGATPTPTPTRTPNGDAAILIGSASASPGDDVFVDVLLLTGGLEIAATENQLALGAEVAVAARASGNPDCTVNPEINRNGTSFVFLPSGCAPGLTCTSVRALVLSLSNLDPIPDGSVLYTCRVSIDGLASPASYPLPCSDAGASDPDGNAIAVQCIDGAVEVTAAGGG